MTESQLTYLADYRPPAFAIDETQLDISLFDDRAIVISRLSMRRNQSETSDTGTKDLELHGQDLLLQRIALDGQELAPDQYTITNDGLTVNNVPDAFVLETEVLIEPQNNVRLEGLYTSQGLFCTQCESEGFRRISYYLDRPDVLSVFTTRIEADVQAYPLLLSNGNLIDSSSCPDDPERHFAVWHDPHRKPCYLFALVAGDLSVLEDTFTTMSGRDVALRIYAAKRYLNRCEYAMQSLKRAMAWDEKAFGREYDLDLFNIVAVEDFVYGAMENKSLNIFNVNVLLADRETATDEIFQRIESVVAHEYFHNWSGNRVTCRDWFQLSLKEGFTVYRDQEFQADMAGRGVKRVDTVAQLRNLQFPDDAGPNAHPVLPASYATVMSLSLYTIYFKGAEIIRMLRRILGEDTFRKATDLYFARHDGEAVTIEEFVRAMEDASGRDLAQFRRWYTQAGTPVVSLQSTYDSDAGVLEMKLLQSFTAIPATEGNKPLHMPISVGLLDAEGNPLPVRLESDAKVGEAEHTRTIELTNEEETLRFVDLDSEPVVSALRDFSAPVTLERELSAEGLALLMRKDADSFGRWQAANSLSTRIILRQSGCQQRPVEEASFLSSIESILASVLQCSARDPAEVPQLLSLPQFADLAGQADLVDVEKILKARTGLATRIAVDFEKQWLAVYDRNRSDAPYKYSAGEAGRRRLRNCALDYLCLANPDLGETLCARQIRASDNLTDTLAALRALVHMHEGGVSGRAKSALQDYYDRWRNDSLMIDHWLSLQATRPFEDAFEMVKSLTKHPSFDRSNPNRARALLHQFAGRNPSGFHGAGRAAYRFICEEAIHLDTAMPMLAAHLVAPLMQFERYAPHYAGPMRAELECLSQKPMLSNHLRKLIDNSLGGPSSRSAA